MNTFNDEDEPFEAVLIEKQSTVLIVASPFTSFELLVVLPREEPTPPRYTILIVSLGCSGQPSMTQVRNYYFSNERLSIYIVEEYFA